MRTALLSALAALMIATPAMAPAAMANDNVVALPPAGTTIVNLSVTERIKLGQDTLSTSLRYEMDGASANEVQDRINKAVTEAVAEAKKSPEVKTSTGHYQVYVYDESQSIDPRTGRPLSTAKKWRGSQSVELQSENPTKLLELAGKIQSMGFITSGLTYSLSPEKAEGVRDSLMEKALKKLGEKAKLAQTALGKGSYDIVDVTIDGAQPSFPVLYKSMARMEMAADAAGVSAPTAEAGESEVTLTVNARVLLKQ